ncbi:transposon Tf2-6 polyprotein [Nephila pilipes]|uniref:Transposon Tf2-6 polyprotein n=1 Tax=Nephila pilipes TaxID=299642 RepID=A0A8X6MS04_NEPPI|nr:transposon Tf2-6 polyprotein [Nephila pilipes]
MFICVTSPVTLLDIEVYEATGTVCADAGASQSVGGELMFKFLKNRGQKFTELYLSMRLADGHNPHHLYKRLQCQSLYVDEFLVPQVQFPVMFLYRATLLMKLKPVISICLKKQRVN